MKLTEIAVGQSVRLVRISGDQPFVDRMHEIGLLPGSEICIHQKLPFGGPLVLSYLSTKLALRIDDARQIEVEDL